MREPNSVKMVSDSPNIPQDLGKLALEGFGWQFLNRVFRQFVQLGISIILARLLLPSDYGLVGMVAIFITLMQTSSDLGLTGALVQKKDVSEEQIHSVFWLNNLASLGLWGTAWLIAPWIANFFDEPMLASIFIASTLSIVLMAPSGVARALIYKQMQFKTSFLIDWAGMLVGGTVSVVLALLKMGVWSLVFGNLATTLCVTITTWRFSSWRPRWIWQPTSLTGITNFGTHYLATRVLQSLTANLDYLLIGKLFSATQLGLYFLAFRLMDLPRVQLGLVIQSVMYPVFIHLQENDERTQDVLFKLGLTTSLMVFPALAALMALAPDLIQLIYGPRWSDSALLLQLLVWAGMISTVDQSVFVMNARGKADWVFRSTLGRTVLFIALIWLGATYGLNYVAAMVSLHAILTTLLFQAWVNRMTGFTYSQYFRSLAPAVFISILICLAIWGVRGALLSFGWNPWTVLSIQLVTAVLVFGLALLLWPGDDIRQLILWLQRRIPLLAHSQWINRIVQNWGIRSFLNLKRV